MKFFVTFWLCMVSGLFFCTNAWAQTCSATISGSSNWSSLPWSCSGGGIAPTTAGVTYNQSITLNGLGNGETLTIDRSVTINGNMTVNASGSNPTIAVAAGVYFRITGSIINPNNNVIYLVNANSTLRVDGTLQGNNNTRFGGTGTVIGGTLNLGNNADCLSPCPTVGFTNCTSGSTGGVANYFCNTYNQSMLPITLVEFRAEAKESQIVLHWSTIKEENNATFVIEHSTDSQNWTRLASIDGAVNSNTAKNYAYTHLLPALGINYYRLKQIDTNGNFTYSPLVSAEMRTLEDLAVYPNPNKDGIIWVRHYYNTAQATLRIYDVVGRLIFEKKLQNIADSFTKIDLQGYEKGTYLLVWQDQKSVKRKKILLTQ